MDGYIDGIVDGAIHGWAYSPDNPRPKVVARIGGVDVGSTVAGDMRWDLVQAGIGNGRHGFRLVIPDTLEFDDRALLSVKVDGRHELRNAKGVGELLGDSSILFDASGGRITSRTSPTEILQDLRRVRKDNVIGPIFASEMTTFVEALLGKSGDTYNLDRVSSLAASIDSAQYVQAHMPHVDRLPDAHANLEHSVAKMTLRGLILEFGVFSAASINKIADARPQDTIHGFDSFEGLPEVWGSIAPKGTFAVAKLPEVAKNVELHVGWFDAALPDFAAKHSSEPVAFLHVDCDLYSSTKTIFDILGARIGAGCIIVFDEYINYPGWRSHEYAAFQEFVKNYNISYEYISFVPTHKQVTVRILGSK